MIHFFDHGILGLSYSYWARLPALDKRQPTFFIVLNILIEAGCQIQYKTGTYRVLMAFVFVVLFGGRVWVSPPMPKNMCEQVHGFYRQEQPTIKTVPCLPYTQA